MGNKQMRSYYIQISCDDPWPEVTEVEKRDNVTFHNISGAQVEITFSHPGVFRGVPGSILTLGIGEARTLIVNQIEQSADYNHAGCDSAKPTRNGRIDPA